MYYDLRGTYNSLLDKTATYASALFIFLNKTCFRGIYRESRKSGFNVPFGNYMKVKLLEPGHAEHLSVMFREVRFYAQSYEVTLRSLDKDALVYLDPPYMPLKPDSFVKYTNDGFSWKDHHNLFHIVARLHHSGVFFVMSNSSVEDVMVVFENFVIERIVCKRKITPKKPNANCVELLITNANKHFGEDTNGAISFPAIL
jgi:DNA adenine methylase